MSFPRYPEYKDGKNELIGQIPTKWTTARLRFLVSIQKGRLPVETSSEPKSETDLPYLTMEYLRADIDNQSSLFVSNNISCLLADEGQILLLWDGSNAGEFLRAKKGAVSSTLALIENININREYLYYGLKAVEKKLKDQTIGMGIPHVSADLLKDLFICVPPLDDQNLIVKFLNREISKIDKLIGEQEKLIEILKEKRQAVISHAVTRGLNPGVKMKDSGVEWLGEVPEHWSFGVLSRIAKRVVVGIAEAATHAYADEGTPILRATNIRAGKIIGDILYVTADYSDGRDTKMLKARDLVTVRTGNAGVTAVIPPELDNCQCFTMLITTLNETSNSDYYCYWANSIASQQYFSLEGWGTAQVNISVPILKSLPVPIPSAKEQLAIVEFLDRETGEIDSLITTCESGIGLLRERRLALISAAVTGQIDVRSTAVELEGS